MIQLSIQKQITKITIKETFCKLIRVVKFRFLKVSKLIIRAWRVVIIHRGLFREGSWLFNQRKCHQQDSFCYLRMKRVTWIECLIYQKIVLLKAIGLIKAKIDSHSFWSSLYSTNNLFWYLIFDIWCNCLSVNNV